MQTKSPDGNGHVLLRTRSGKERQLPKLCAGWKWVHVADVTEVVRGASPRPKGDPRYFGGKIPWIMISDVTRQPGKYLFETKQGVTDAGAELSRKLPAGSLILSNSGTVCVPKILRVDGCIHDGFVAFPTLEKSVDLNFAYYWFEAVRPRIIDENRQGVTQVNLNTGIVREMPFPLAPRDEQERIVAEIEKQFTRLDAGVALLKRVQTALKRYRTSVLKAACEGRLVPTEAELARKENRSCEARQQLLQHILKERREKWNGKGKYKEAVGPGVADLPNLPAGWSWAGTEQLTAGIDNAMTIGPFGSNLMVKDYREAGVPLIFVREIRSENFQRSDTRYISKEKADELATHRVRGGDLVITKMGEPPGDTAIYPEGFPDAIATSDCIKLTPNRSGTSAAFLKYAIRSQPVKDQIERITRGVAQKKVSLARFKTVAVPFPPLAEQQRIVAEIERRFSVIEELETVISTELQRSIRLRKAILQEAFRG